MASQRWVTAAPTVAQVSTITFATYDAATTYGTLINGKPVTQIGTGGTITATVAALLVKLQASTEPEYLEYTWTASLGVLTYTANTSGKSGTVTGTVAGGTGTQTPAAVTANSGINVWDIAANWSTAVPIAADTIYFDNSDVDALYDLSQAGATVTTGYILQSFTGTIGLPKFNTDAGSYTEYRPDYLALDCSTWEIGKGPGQGSSRIKINSGSVQTKVSVFNTGNPLEPSIGAFIWKGTHASNAMNVTAGVVGVAMYGGEVATLLTLNVDGGTVRIGKGTTLGTVVVNGGNVEINCAIATAITVYGGTVTINGTGAVASLAIYGGRVFYNTTGTLGGAPVVYQPGVLSFDGDPQAKTVTNPIDTNYTGGVVDTDKVVASLIVDYNGATPIRGLGTNVRITRGAPA